ncbi:hypothetical protein Acr_24g0009350 [Actinidia rufa]|uniref:Uncharacterized protein n=1 Tax=Actinidia rufa TaxID=165716 RepID=A0A7J0GV68_9ERIC|nr:hypothetical protein Acr_24g0009350 [Actinidia rufa]
MAKGDKVLLCPGFIATCMPVTSVQLQKRSNGELDDVDYRHQDNENDHDDIDSSDSFEQEIIKMPPGGRPTHSYLDPQCGDNMMSEKDKMEHLKAKQHSQDNAISMTQEELSIKVLGPRSGYVTGFGMRPSSSSRSIVGLGDNITYVTQLEQKVQKQVEQIQEQAEGIEVANNKILELVEAKRRTGEDFG